MDIAGLLKTINNSSFDEMREECRKGKSIVEFAEAVLETMDGMCKTSKIRLSKNGLMIIVEYFGAFPHCRFGWKSSIDDYLLNNQVFDTVFDGVERIMTYLNEEDAEILWNWYVSRKA